MKFKKTALLLVLDVVLLNVAFFAALWLRFEGNVPARFEEAYQGLVVPYTLIMIAVFAAFGLYNRLWKYASVEDVLAVAGAVLGGAALFWGASIFFYHTWQELLLPRSVVLICVNINLILTGASRLSFRFLRQYTSMFNTGYRRGKLALIVGAGDAGAMVAREIKKHNGGGAGGSHEVLGFVDDDKSKLKQRLFGIPVLGTSPDIPSLVERFRVEEIIIAIPSASGETVRRIVDICSRTNARLMIVPGMYELIDGRKAISQIREVKVEDLLDRAPVELNLEAITGYLNNRVVLVTGAGGSIGSELCRQLMRFSIHKLILLDHSENSLYEIYHELSERFAHAGIIPVMGDLKESASLKEVFKKCRPQVVFHAAAHKHVPLVELNAAQAVKNNILGTWNLACCAQQYQIEAFIFVSTDKAVNPVSVMGATKRISEMIIQKMARENKTRFGSVRFGNVLDSRGSVVPLFKSQIQSGGPVTITHPQMTRYFMTIPEAVQLIIQAGSFVRRGEVFILDMGRPVKIVELAKKMIKLAGYRPEEIAITYTGIRPGEKLQEELLAGEENVSRTTHERIFVSRPEVSPYFNLDRLLQTLSDPLWHAPFEDVVILLQSVLPTFGKEPEQGGENQPEMKSKSLEAR